MRRVSILQLAAGAAILAASTASAMAGGWGYGGWGNGGGWGGGCGCGGCGCGSSVAVSYTPVTTYTAYTVYRPTTAYVASYARVVPYEQAYVVEQGPYYRPALTGYRTASYTYDEPRAYPYVRVRKHYGWRGYDRWDRRHVTYRHRVKYRSLPIGYK